MKRRVAPIIAAILLLLPVLYVGSYLALVSPRPDNINYGPHYTATLSWVFWPLEKIDRKLRTKREITSACWDYSWLQAGAV